MSCVPWQSQHRLVLILPHQNSQRTPFFRRLFLPLLPLSIRLSLLREKFVLASALVDIVPTISSHTRTLPVPLLFFAVAPGNLILFEALPKMPPSALISVHTVGCAWRLLMCYVNTLPKCRRVAGETFPACPFGETPSSARQERAPLAGVGGAATRESTEEN